MWGNKHDIGGIVKTADGIHPTNAGASTTTNGPAIDRTGYQSCVLRHACGAAAGSPTAQTADAKLQSSADGSTGWADISGAAATQLTADNGGAELDVDLAAVTDSYIRVVSTVALTAGTSPTLPVSATVVLGGADSLPA